MQKEKKIKFEMEAKSNGDPFYTIECFFTSLDFFYEHSEKKMYYLLLLLLFYLVSISRIMNEKQQKKNLEFEREAMSNEYPLLHPRIF